MSHRTIDLNLSLLAKNLPSLIVLLPSQHLTLWKRHVFRISMHYRLFFLLSSTHGPPATQVTSVSGFTGSHIAEQLLQAGYSVRG